MKIKNKRVYTAPECSVLHLDSNSLLQTISTKVDSDGATTGGRAQEMDFNAFNSSWDEEAESE